MTPFIILAVMWNGSQPTFGHSLGALRFANLAAWGVVPGGTTYALPFGMIAPSGVSVLIGSRDPITGWSLGQLFNPDATVLPTNHFMSNYNAALNN